ncbi:hypothetical protein CHLRE_02g107000v5 [Chlamydomonas reinhardtii]|uniref:cyclin-dependent kinase n=1 Tax=Chlamydomonas reinhardtii TaxID=3055 RepID=A0A2K3E2P8_CHLRE|nr:uncharacterized protein CHLRE_02g107000v5 [Chlamydomonas reinhardtii]PNW87053.1 hypothetical protein CHLRE_02g107000v5 [Chlamydomonas reinhardtii]
MDSVAATQFLGPLIAQLPCCCEALERILSTFGWAGAPVGGFTRAVDLGGLCLALEKHLYSRVSELGRGMYGTVWCVVNRETGKQYALKQVANGAYGMTEATLREVSCLRELSGCPNIVGLQSVMTCPSARSTYLLMDLLDCDLHTFLEHAPIASELRVIKSIMFQVLSGLRHAHANSVMHRDLKPQNVLLGVTPSPPAGTPSVVVKIADFGLSRGFVPEPAENAHTDWVVTLYYRAPEMLLGSKSYGPGVDVWSAGCVLAELLNVSPMFKSDCEVGLLYDIFQKMGTPTPKTWPDLPAHANFSPEFPLWPGQPLEKLVPRLASDAAGADLLKRMLSINPRRRLTASQAMQHPWFDEVRALAQQGAGTSVATAVHARRA